ncbi:MAG: hypothetical protein R3284_11320 [Rubricoccaceae bacterium]|nr:hypothetical protein [Rubricoccaceae bacterium]
MDATEKAKISRFASITALAGSACAITGAALWMASGTDIDVALARDDMAGYLAEAGANSGLLVANLTIWIVMAVLMAAAATAMTMLDGKDRLTSRLARFCYWAGAPLVITSYVAWLAIVVKIAPDTSPASVALAETVGWFASRADWVATILYLSLGPTFLSMGGCGSWVPTWLWRWSNVALFAGLLNAIAMLTGGSGLSTYGFVIIPVGVGWMIAAGIVLLRYK